VTAFEELGGSEGNEEVVEAPAKSSAKRPAKSGKGSGETAAEVSKGELPATRKQLNYLEALIGDVVDDGVPKFEEMVGKKIAELTREEASEWIGRLSGKAA
jgi:phosphosulfolactate synthase (CoM biosynthesis protein A)